MTWLDPWLFGIDHRCRGAEVLQLVFGVRELELERGDLSLQELHALARLRGADVLAATHVGAAERVERGGEERCVGAAVAQADEVRLRTGAGDAERVIQLANGFGEALDVKGEVLVRRGVRAEDEGEVARLHGVARCVGRKRGGTLFGALEREATVGLADEPVGAAVGLGGDGDGGHDVVARERARLAELELETEVVDDLLGHRAAGEDLHFGGDLIVVGTGVGPELDGALAADVEERGRFVDRACVVDVDPDAAAQTTTQLAMRSTLRWSMRHMSSSRSSSVFALRGGSRIASGCV